MKFPLAINLNIFGKRQETSEVKASLPEPDQLWQQLLEEMRDVQRLTIAAGPDLVSDEIIDELIEAARYLSPANWMVSTQRIIGKSDLRKRYQEGLDKVAEIKRALTSSRTLLESDSQGLEQVVDSHGLKTMDEIKALLERFRQAHLDDGYGTTAMYGKDRIVVLSASRISNLPDTFEGLPVEMLVEKMPEAQSRSNQ